MTDLTQSGDVSSQSAVTGWRRMLPPPWRNPAPVVGVVRLSGIIGSASPLRPGLTIGSTAQSIEKAFSLRHLKAVAIVINSPGGSPVQSTLIFKRIRALAQEKSVPVFAFCEDVAASGGYLLALAGDEIIADASSIVGSIGVVSAGFGLHEAIGRLGIERRVYTAGEDKMILDPFRPEKPEDVAKLKAIQAEIHDVFKSLVRERRGAAIEEREDELFTGAFWTGMRARELGLIDAIGDVRSVMRTRYGERVKLKVMTTSRGWPWQRGSVVRRHDMATGSGLAGDVLSTLEERTLWARYGF